MGTEDTHPLHRDAAFALAWARFGNTMKPKGGSTETFAAAFAVAEAAYAVGRNGNCPAGQLSMTASEFVTNFCSELRLCAPRLSETEIQDITGRVRQRIAGAA